MKSPAFSNFSPDPASYNSCFKWIWICAGVCSYIKLYMIGCERAVIWRLSVNSSLWNRKSAKAQGPKTATSWHFDTAFFLNNMLYQEVKNWLSGVCKANHGLTIVISEAQKEIMLPLGQTAAISISLDWRFICYMPWVWFHRPEITVCFQNRFQRCHWEVSL